MKNLILITSEFPYYSGEPFLLNELPYLSKAFKQIYLFSINGSKKDAQTREVPINVQVYPLEDIKSNVKYIFNIAVGCTPSSKELKIKAQSIKHVLVSLYTRGRSQRIAKRIYQIIRNEKLDVKDTTVYSFWFAYQAVAGWLLADMLKNDGSCVYTVARAHGYDLYWERASGGFLPFQDVSLRKLDKCFPCSDYGTKYLLEKYPWAESVIQTARLGTKDHGLNPYNGEKTLVTCCNLEPLKRMSLFAKAFCKLAKKDKSLKWICIGSGEQESQIIEIIKKAGLEKQVIMTGRLSNDKVMDIYKTQGIMFFCNVSTSEGIPVSIMEAQSFGIPVIATDVGGTNELVNNRNGLLIDADMTYDTLYMHLKHSFELSQEMYNTMRRTSRETYEVVSSDCNNYSKWCECLMGR